MSETAAPPAPTRADIMARPGWMNLAMQLGYERTDDEGAPFGIVRARTANKRRGKQQ